MTELKDTVARFFRDKPSAPFLFVGSGFSRRYLGLEDWAGLLTRFCSEDRPFEYYKSKSNNSYPLAAQYISESFHDHWWTADEYRESRKKHSKNLTHVSDPLKCAISDHLLECNLDGIDNNELQKEISTLRTMNVDGIITTNWDLFLEELFPDYKTFIGQDQLLFSDPQSIAEIYKIHGCASEPNSLVLTDKDYANFKNKNPYLAAKLITIFIEHPIVFIGYSVNDPHIQEIIFSIASCLREDHHKLFGENLIFLNRSNGEDETIHRINFARNGTNINATGIRTDNFSDIYEAISENKRKIPARVLRHCKEQMYELVKSSNPETKLAVIDIDDLDSTKDVEFVVGVGVAQKQVSEAAEAEKTQEQNLAKSGYRGVKLSDLFEDVVSKNSKYDAEQLLESVYPEIVRTNARFVPVFRYLSSIGINSKKELDKSKFAAARKIVTELSKRKYTTSSYARQYESTFRGKTTQQIIDEVNERKVALLVPFQEFDEVDLDALEKFVSSHKIVDIDLNYQSFFRKLVCYFDRAKYGFPY